MGRIRGVGRGSGLGRIQRDHLEFVDPDAQLVDANDEIVRLHDAASLRCAASGLTAAG
jgi:hypothetical protein